MAAIKDNNVSNLVHLNDAAHNSRKACLFCGKETGLIKFKKQDICFCCLKRIRQLYIEGYFCQNG